MGVRTAQGQTEPLSSFPEGRDVLTVGKELEEDFTGKFKGIWSGHSMNPAVSQCRGVKPVSRIC